MTQSSEEIDRQANVLIGIRNEVSKNQTRQAKRMLEKSKKYTPEVAIGSMVALHVADVDKGLTDAPNLICRVVDFLEDRSLYELACEVGYFIFFTIYLF